jgi:predicted transcriptional regulator
MHQKLTPSDLIVINRRTGEELDVAIFVNTVKQTGWEKAYADVLGSYIDCGGSKSATVLSWIIKNRTSGNLILGTQIEIAEKSKASLSVVKSVIKKLIEKGFMKRENIGRYMITPRMIRNGDNVKGVINFQYWENIGKVETETKE